MDIAIVGTGNVAYHLVRMLSRSAEINVLAVCGTSLKKAKYIIPKGKRKTIKIYDDLVKIPAVDMVIIAVTDTAITSVSKELSANENLTNSIVAHTSGSVSTEVLQDHKWYGAYYPLQTFTKGRRMGYRAIPHCIYSPNDRVEMQLTDIANLVSNDVRLINDEERKQIHLSAVLVNNMVNHIIHLAKTRLDSADISSDILTPLIQETVAKLSNTSAYEAQTGPARRADQKTIQNQLRALDNNPLLQDIYQLISQSIIKTYHP